MTSPESSHLRFRSSLTFSSGFTTDCSSCWSSSAGLEFLNHLGGLLFIRLEGFPLALVEGNFLLIAQLLIKVDVVEILLEVIRNLREFIFSQQGKELAEKCGLVPINN